jgi:hypothetical protein
MMIDFVRQIETPWSLYAVTFSRDGSRLAMGGGSWYGHGGIIRLDMPKSVVGLFDVR